jgi:hypothetical protein
MSRFARAFFVGVGKSAAQAALVGVAEEEENFFRTHRSGQYAACFSLRNRQESIAIVGVRQRVSLLDAAAHAAMEECVAGTCAFCRDGLHHSLTGVCAVAGFFVDVFTPQTLRAVIGVAAPAFVVHSSANSHTPVVEMALVVRLLAPSLPLWRSELVPLTPTNTRHGFVVLMPTVDHATTMGLPRATMVGCATIAPAGLRTAAASPVSVSDRLALFVDPKTCSEIGVPGSKRRMLS